MSVQQFCLRWNNHQPNFISVFTTMLNNEFLVDVTLAAEGKELHAHKIILSACSVYFQNLFATYPKKHAIVIMKDIKYADLRIIVDFMYYGEVNVSEEQLPAILEIAKLLKIKGLTEMPESTSVTKSQSMSSERADLLTPGESSWSSDTRRQSVSPFNTSPSLRRKRSASIEKPAERQCNNSTLLKNPDMKITVSLNQNQQNIKLRSKELHFQSFHPSRDSLDENGGIDNNVNESTSNFISRPDNINAEEPSTANLQQGAKLVTALVAKRGRLLIRQQRIKKGPDNEFEDDDDDGEDIQSEKPNPKSKLSKTVGRQMSEPAPQTLSLDVPVSALKKQMSHPLPEKTSKESSSTVKVSFNNPEKSLKKFTHPEITSSDMSFESVASCDAENILVELPSWTPSTDPLDFRENANQSTGDSLANMRVRHCPVIRQGPALSCNFCWNTIDDQGRISRRKTKYHCPECSTNLCIVPCFYEYHERLSN